LNGTASAAAAAQQTADNSATTDQWLNTDWPFPSAVASSLRSGPE
jgi:hypothetical protein